MTMPGFFATTSLAPSAGRYRAAAGGAAGTAMSPRLAPQQFDNEVLSPFEEEPLSYACESSTNKCICKGVADCMNMKGSGDCHGAQVYDDVGGYCRWH